MSRLPTLEKKNGHVDLKLAKVEIDEPQEVVQPVAKVEMGLEQVVVEFKAMTGIDIGDPRKNIQVRLNRRQAKAMRHLLLGFEANRKSNGRRSNEQDMLRDFCDRVADMLNLQ